MTCRHDDARPTDPSYTHGRAELGRGETWEFRPPPSLPPSSSVRPSVSLPMRTQKRNPRIERAGARALARLGVRNMMIMAAYKEEDELSVGRLGGGRESGRRAAQASHLAG